MHRRTFLSAAPALLLPCTLSQASAADAPSAADIDLPDTEGRRRKLADWQGKVLSLFFGYLSCPDVCPTHLARQLAALDLLGAQAKRVQTLFVTLDPVRDTPERMRAYLAAFDPSFLGLRGSEADTRRMATRFGCVYRKQPVKDSAISYLIEHSAYLIAFDLQGHARQYVPYRATAAELAQTLSSLIKIA